MLIHGTLGWSVRRGVAAALVLFVPAFCLLGAAPVVAADAECAGYHVSAKVCGQSGPSEPLPGVIPHVLPVQDVEFPAAWLAGTPNSDPVLQLRAAPSSPRAPPLLFR